MKRLYAHFVEGAQSFAIARGITGRWVSVDQIGYPDYAREVLEWCADPNRRFILFIYLIEGRVRDTGGGWHVMNTPLQWMRDVGIAHQCEAIQFDDEFWSRLYTGGTLNSPHWPMHTGMTHVQAWETRWQIADLLEVRARELQTYWHNMFGTPCPMIGMAETGGCTPPQFPTQQWWGLNFYQNARIDPATGRRFIQNLYRLAWEFTRDKRTLLQPVYPIFGGTSDPDFTNPSVEDLTLTYATPQVVREGATVKMYDATMDHPQTWSAGIFCVKHPHEGGLGLTNMDPSYQEWTRWLAAHMGRLA